MFSLPSWDTENNFKEETLVRKMKNIFNIHKCGLNFILIIFEYCMYEYIGTVYNLKNIALYSK